MRRSWGPAQRDSHFPYRDDGEEEGEDHRWVDRELDGCSAHWSWTVFSWAPSLSVILEAAADGAAKLAFQSKTRSQAQQSHMP